MNCHVLYRSIGRRKWHIIEPNMIMNLRNLHLNYLKIMVILSTRNVKNKFKLELVLPKNFAMPEVQELYC